MEFRSRCERCTDGDLHAVTVFSKDVFDVDFENYLPLVYAKDAGTGHNHYVVKEDGEIAAAVLNYPLDLIVGNRTVKTYGVGTVCVREESRRRGYMADMLGSCLLESSEEGAVISVLSGNRQRYEHYGYSLGGTWTGFKESSESIRRFYGDRKSEYTLREATAEDGETLVQLMKTQEIYCHRDADKFLIAASHDYRLVYLILDGGSPVGYFITSRELDYVDEIVLLPGADADEFVLALYEFSGHGFTVAAPRHRSELCRKFFVSCDGWNCGAESNVCVLDFPAAISAFGTLGCSVNKYLDGEFVIGIEAHPFFEQIGIAKDGVTHGTFEIRVRDGEMTAVPTDREPSLILPYLRAIELLFIDCADWYPGADAWVRSVLPLPFYYPGADKV